MANSNTSGNLPGVPASLNANSIPKVHNQKELISLHGVARESDPDLRTFDAILQARTNQVLSTLASGIDFRSLSLDSLKEMTECLLEMNQEVIKVILDSKKEIWRNQELFDLVQDYFETSLHTLDFCAALENCLKHALDAHLTIFATLHRFEEEGGERCCSYSKILEELTKFKETGDPFTEEFFKIFQMIHKQQKFMLKKLRIKKEKIDKKLRSIETWRKVSSLILFATFAAILICSVLTAAVAAPPVAAALVAATAIPMDAIGKWIDSLWKKYENALRGQKEVITLMQESKNARNTLREIILAYMNNFLQRKALQDGTSFAVKDLNKIKIVIDPLEEVEIKSLLQKADLPIDEGAEAVNLAIADIKMKLRDFMKDIEGLRKYVDKCNFNIKRSRIMVLQRIIKPPTNCNGAPILL